MVPTLCPHCRGTEMTLTTFAPATVKAVEHQRAAPKPVALYGDVGYHVVEIACAACDWSKRADGCPLCGGPAPLRDRP